MNLKNKSGKKTKKQIELKSLISDEKNYVFPKDAKEEDVRDKYEKLSNFFRFKIGKCKTKINKYELLKNQSMDYLMKLSDFYNCMFKPGDNFKALCWKDLLDTSYLEKKIIFDDIFDNLYFGGDNIKKINEYYNCISVVNKRKLFYDKKLKLIENNFRKYKSENNIVDEFDKKTGPCIIKYSTGTKQLSSGEKKVTNCLDKIKDLYYFVGYKWNCCRNKNVLQYDFFCLKVVKKHMYIFNIEFDGGQHFKSNKLYDFQNIHRNDILKQYYMVKMNIHMLRLNDFLNIKKEINNFIEKIITSDKYIIQNPIQPIPELFDDTNIHTGLKYFHAFYDEYCKTGKLPKITYENIKRESHIDIKFPKIDKYYDIRPEYMKQNIKKVYKPRTKNDIIKL
ncbi:hypothetical protein ma15 [Moumouvirus australiensis]|uniref:DUF5889 domain-containing protein n=1 Tax=Moumouvirus australiensis TaxID=2109587 RepID=A0A2P1EKI2_9VIRU|nr:hypothetical protein QKC55_gp899 [Moumouvirus australiensis]YP_010789336.1 hypothetical protein QKC55_gp888 [Moumouvirus australiensis]AVL94391.1 hypothetical protein ma4 [Moumouvirus australiensis]AVL94402.1 hypothetical protein ma15 [Moumouvirus australiensis]